MFGGIIFCKNPLFKGRDNYDQLVKIAMVMGTPKLEDYLAKYKLKLDRRFNDTMGQQLKKDWKTFITSENKRFCTDLSLDWLDRLLRYDPAERLTAEEAMAHPFLANVPRGSGASSERSSTPNCSNTTSNGGVRKP